MSIHSSSLLDYSSSWYLVYTEGGSAAVVHVDDMVQMLGSGLVRLAIRVSFEEGVYFERARAADMSANHRLKSG